LVVSSEDRIDAAERVERLQELRPYGGRSFGNSRQPGANGIIEPVRFHCFFSDHLLVNYDRLGLKFMTWDEWIAPAGAKSQ
jgi:hypothetical protein